MKIGEGTVVFITGGASGLGEATARMVHAKGARLVIADMNESRMKIIQDELGARVLTVLCDVTKEADVKNAIERTVKEFGAIHVALACAGVAWITPTLTSRGPMDMKIFEAVVRINLLGTAYVAKYAALHMSKQEALNDRGEKGCILFVSSVAAEEGQRGQTAYGASKGALNGMVLPMARDLGKFGIRVAAIAPGIF